MFDDLYRNSEMAGSRLALVDVNLSNASTTWPLLLASVKNADFVALDLVSCLRRNQVAFLINACIAGIEWAGQCAC